MFMKVRFKCDCGCKSEFNSDTTATRIFCPNCGNELPEADSEKVLSILRNTKDLSDDYSGLFAQKTLEFVTSQWEGVLKNPT